MWWYQVCLYGGRMWYIPQRLYPSAVDEPCHGRASGTPTPCSRRTPTAFGKTQLSTVPTGHRIPGWSDEVTCLAYLRVRVLCQPTLRPLGMAVSSHNSPFSKSFNITHLTISLSQYSISYFLFFLFISQLIPLLSLSFLYHNTSLSSLPFILLPFTLFPIPYLSLSTLSPTPTTPYISFNFNSLLFFSLLHPTFNPIPIQQPTPLSPYSIILPYNL